ncbi:MAG: urocanate hydratase, partial [Saprospiraceae bacterium]|nr:urocanate hydratase [Saprospiraceae bacterium]
MLTQTDFAEAVKMGIPQAVPDEKPLDPNVSHAPLRNISDLSTADRRLAVSNALRYFPPHQHAQLAPEFAHELNTYGRIYMYRYRPDYPMYARPLEAYPHRSQQAAAIMLMIQNNLDPLVAKHPHELITYGGNGAVFQNWAQYLLTMRYLAEMTDTQTLVLYSGHPLGLFPSHAEAPRVVVTNGMMIPNYSSKADWNRFNALGVTQYGQMTAGSFMYIGPQ